LEEGDITISRAVRTLTFPSSFMLAAAMNPCPCGYWNSVAKECVCTPPQIQRYVSKISGPLLDRIDIHLDVPEVHYKELTAKPDGEASKAVAARVRKARKIQLARFRRSKPSIFSNAHMRSRQLERLCQLDEPTREILRSAIDKLGFSARAYTRILKVARTIADLEGSDSILSLHVSEAIQYRSLDRNFWQSP
jgi:magnesium chelatase family protein